MRVPPLTSLRAFEAAARFASFTLAAQALCVTTGAISRQVKLLEAHLGVQLFVRHHRKVALTAAGQRYVSAVSRIFAELSEAGEALGRETQQALVRLEFAHGKTSGRHGRGISASRPPRRRSA